MYALLCQTFTAQGLVCVVPNYTLWPKHDVHGMVQELALVLQWVQLHITQYGGDNHNIHVMGHSAGGQLASLLITNKLLSDVCSHDVQTHVQWELASIRSVIPLASLFDIATHYEHERKRGVHRLSPMARCMRGSEMFAFASPLQLVTRLHAMEIKQLPEFVMVHGDIDTTCPCSHSVDFARCIRERGGCARAVLLHNVSHSDIVVALMVPTHEHHDIVLQSVVQHITSR
eukprot:TRINITY_DN4399_c0_g1_i2.p1 TRINITY_DN4399_c0_g1~~TRINITY_DN4399_c0_g1_i2.p1  ORF type:complete len:230 (+),score=38.45 TRINITY_DN4399_c0_g1_i2:389-1078(+)